MTTSTNYTSISYAEESTPGVSPTGNYQLLPSTGGSPTSSLSTAISNVIRNDRMTDDLVLVDAEISGDLNYELSYGPYMPLIKSVLRNTSTTVTVDGTGTSTISVVDNGDGTATLSGGSDWLSTSGVQVGGVYKFDNFSNSSNNGYFEVVSVSNTEVTIKNDSAASETLSTPKTYIIQGDFITNGAETMKTYTFLKMIEGITNTAYFYYKGCAVSQMSFSFSTGSILTGTLSVIGREENPTETPIHSGVNDTGNYSIMNSVNNVVGIEIEGLTSTTCFESMDLTINNNTSAAKCIGTLGAADVADFVCDVTANVSLYFEDLVAYNKFINSQSFSVKIILEDGDIDSGTNHGNIIVINMPKCKFESLDIPIDGKDNFLMQSGSFRALRDATSNYQIGFTFINNDEVYP